MNSPVEHFGKQMLILWVDVYYYESCIIVCAVLLFPLSYYSQRTAKNLVEDDKKINVTRNSLLWKFLQWIKSQNTYRNTVFAERVRKNANVITGARTGS
jgi:hypothetical protein